MSSPWGECGRTSRIRRSRKFWAQRRSSLAVAIAGRSSHLKSENSSRWLKRRAIPIAHIKLHGALYHVVERDKDLASVYAAFVKERFPGTRLIASPRGELIGAARSCGVQAWGELFSDRAYTPQGELVPRSQPGAVLTDWLKIRGQMETFRASGAVSTIDGTLLVLDAQTVCVHADSPNALRIARLLASLFRAAD